MGKEKIKTENDSVLLKGHNILLPTDNGLLKVTHYSTQYKDQPYMSFAHLHESPEGIAEIPVLRIHSRCLFAESYGSKRCDCSEQLDEGLKSVIANKGLLIYLDQDGRGHTLGEKFHEYQLQNEEGLDTIAASQKLGLEPDARKYDVVADILKSIGITRVKILTNNPDKAKKLETLGIEVVEIIPSHVEANPFNREYIKRKSSFYKNEKKN